MGVLPEPAEGTAFSCPGNRTVADELHLMAVGFLAGLLDRLVARFGRVLARDGDGVVSALEALVAHSWLDHETSWSLGLGMNHRALCSGDQEEAKRAIAATLLHATGRGMTT
jgi:hypothetical protein